MQLLTANHKESFAFKGWTEQVTITADGQWFIRRDLRVDSDLLVSDQVRLFQEVEGGEAVTFTRQMLHLARANVIMEGKRHLLVLGRDPGEDVAGQVHQTARLLSLHSLNPPRHRRSQSSF